MTDGSAQHPPAPAPRPGPRPAPSPSALAGRRPAAPRTPAAAAPQADRTAAVAAAVEHGRVGGDTTVYVRTADGERAVGQYPDASEAQALEYYAHKYLDLVDAAALLEERLAAGASGDSIRASARNQQAALAEAAVVGDLAALAARLEGIQESAARTAAAQAKERESARAEGLARRTAVVEEAESIAGTDPARVQWKSSGARMAALFDEWKSIQANSPRLPRAQDQELWGRFSKARNTFDRHRREFFSDLDKRNAEGKRIKAKLVEEAEALSHSTDWRGTAQQYRALMDRWKAAPRAGRKDDDALWARFRGAQDVFFAAREKENEAIDAAYGENLVVKEELLARARALLPITDPAAAKRELRTIQEAWEDAGKVPRADVSRMEGGLREVERALAAAEDAEWKRTDPETRNRTSGMLAQLEAAIAGLEDDLARAEASGDEKRIAEARTALEARRAWYDQVSRTAEQLG
ncbi:DUF349 domain-containing protein [Brevibacterium ihuae]|uniref:DUF349 domain-containing protein n=1 Tax=Brevibacterium ihuae TaxID=1631743 RepID=UPI000C78113F|nr:DUF349 domain-containing protein [Brevibacterium ihuae]